ncbi:hypothetical protein ABN028_34015 [Actinopolymorpha sp. B17G11]|uniref:hypothetical protein n=1 Tax=Actinopolymorpha sp. B17G11 TaxID=3160861 RepID=UPI0032E473A6
MSAETSFTGPDGPDGLPFGPDEPAVTAGRASRLADELAALAEQLIRVMGWQQQALTLAASDVPEQVRAGRIADAHRINTRAQASLRLLRDCLGEQHVECDELAHQLTILLDGRSGRTSDGRRRGTGVAG